MEIESIGFLGIPTDAIEPMATFLKDVLGLKPGRHESGWVVFRIPTGERAFVELFQPGNHDDRLFPETLAHPTPAFNVRDLAVARDELVAAGVEIIRDLVWANDLLGENRLPGFGWLFFRAPDGRVYCLQQVRPVA